MKKILIYAIIVFFIIQFIRINKDNPPVKKEMDYTYITKAPSEVKAILKKACYDCHSNEINYPGYANIAPISWYIKEHINQGKEYVNFSEYGNYNQYQKEHINSALHRVIENKSMPLSSYIMMHKEANLSHEENRILLQWFSSLHINNKQ